MRSFVNEKDAMGKSYEIIGSMVLTLTYMVLGPSSVRSITSRNRNVAVQNAALNMGNFTTNSILVKKIVIRHKILGHPLSNTNPHVNTIFDRNDIFTCRMLLPLKSSIFWSHWNADVQLDTSPTFSVYACNMDASTNIFQPCINPEESVINWGGFPLDTHDLIAGSSLMQLGDDRNTQTGHDD